MAADGKGHQQLHDVAWCVELSGLGITRLLRTTYHILEYCTHHSIAHFVGMQVGSLHEHLTDREELVALGQSTVDVGEVQVLGIVLFVHEVGQDVAHVVGERVEIVVERSGNLSWCGEHLLHGEPRCVEECKVVASQDALQLNLFHLLRSIGRNLCKLLHDSITFIIKHTVQTAQ